ncbi:MAG: hypothetical protein OXH81_06555 [Gemmatimonadetes bacterium]|nr:hypothetical protein [Gemmatimonadota bacterium]
MRRTLPLHPPPIRSYLFNAYPLSILAQADAYLPWLYSTHIQLFNFPGEELKFYIQPFSTRHEVRHVYFSTCPFLDIQTIDRKVLGLATADLVPWMVSCIDRGYYLQTDVDFFHLPDRPHYQRHHFIHEVLVSGYDTEECTLVLSGFDEQGAYAVSRMPFDVVERACSFTREGHIQQALQAGSPLPAWFLQAMGDRPRVFLYKYLPDPQYAFDPCAVAEQLTDYLSAADTSQRYRLLAAPREGGCWGTGVYSFLRCELENPVAYRDIPWRILWEHKTCMQARLQYMEAQGYLDPAEQLGVRFGVVERKARSLRLVLLRWKTHQRSDTLTRAGAMLDVIATEERPLLERVLEALSR